MGEGWHGVWDDHGGVGASGLVVVWCGMSEARLQTGAARKLDALRAVLAEMESVVVAYSGGADSAFLAAVADDVLGDRRPWP